MRITMKDYLRATAIIFSIATVVALFAYRPASADTDNRVYQHTIVRAVAGVPDVGSSPAAVSVSGVSAATATDLTPYSYVRIACTADTHFDMGNAGVTATTGDPLVFSSLPEIFNLGNVSRIAFITDGGTGTCYVTLLR